jgi:hypothetical protein
MLFNCLGIDGLREAAHRVVRDGRELLIEDAVQEDEAAPTGFVNGQPVDFGFRQGNAGAIPGMGIPGSAYRRYVGVLPVFVPSRGKSVGLESGESLGPKPAEPLRVCCIGAAAE